MGMMYCTECGKQISSEATACPNCGKPVKSTGNVIETVENQEPKTWKKVVTILCCIFVPIIGIILIWAFNYPKDKKIKIILSVILTIYAIGMYSSSGSKNSNEPIDAVPEIQTENTKNNNPETKNKEEVVYNKNDVKIIYKGCEFHSITDYVSINLRVENNSNKNISLDLNGDIEVNGYSLDSYLYESVNKKSKKNLSFNAHGLSENDIKKENFSDIHFILNIVNSNNFDYIDEGIDVKLKIKK